jgi:hypothetical protein
MAQPFETELSLYRGNVKKRIQLKHPLTDQLISQLIWLSSEEVNSTFIFNHLLNENPLFWAIPSLANAHAKILKELTQQSSAISLGLFRQTILNIQELGQEAVAKLSSPP